MPSENIFVLLVNFITSLLNVNIISIKKKYIYKHFLLIQKDLKNYFNITARDLKKKKIDKSSCFIINIKFNYLNKNTLTLKIVEYVQFKNEYNEKLCLKYYFIQCTE